MDIQKIADTIIRGEKAITFPLKINSGRVSDQKGHPILDIRGWGFIQYADQNTEEIQDGIGQWVVDALNRDWKNKTFK
ncbi:MAG: hypothetical protein WC788_08200 [Candidatus Paceibacterota bacterium]|jgi:hypothetical protein